MKIYNCILSTVELLMQFTTAANEADTDSEHKCVVHKLF
jgi:hypothetical protein